MRITFRTLDGAIRQLGMRDGRWTEPEDTPHVDVSSGWAVGGLLDAHAHLSSEPGSFDEANLPEIRVRAFAAIEAGVFLVLDKGYRDDVVLQIVDEPPAQRPTLEAAGRMIATPGGYFPAFAREVDPEDLPAAVAEQAGRSRGWVKIVGDWPRTGRGAVVNFGMEVLQEAVSVAHAGGARVSIHSMARSASLAVEAGVDSIEHGLFLTEHDVTALAARGGTWVPTLHRMESVLSTLRPGGTGAQLLAEGLDNVRDLLPVAEECGLAVLSGTDLAVPVDGVALEVGRLIHYGLSAGAAVAWATDRGYRHLGYPAEARVGDNADLVVFGVHPIDDPSTLERPVVVIRHGRVLRSHAGFQGAGSDQRLPPGEGESGSQNSFCEH